MRRHSLRVFIQVIFVAVVFASVATMATYTYVATSRAILQVAYGSIDQASKAAIQKTLDDLMPLEHAAVVIADRAAARWERRGSEEARNELLAEIRHTLLIQPHLLNLYVGDEEGSFVQGIRIPGGLTRYGEKHIEIPPGSTHIFRTIDRRAEPPLEVWEYRARDGSVLASERIDDVVYDPRARPWYARGSGCAAACWSEVYQFFSLQVPGITAASPVRDEAGRVRGVAAADVTLDILSSYLAALEIGESGLAFLLDDRGGAVAAPWMTGAETTEVPAPVAAATARIREGETLFVFSHQGIDYVASSAPVPAPFGGWSLGVVVPRDDFVGEIGDITRIALLLSIAVALAGVLVVTVVARNLAASIRALASESRAVREFDLAGDVELRSRIEEVHELSDSLASMKRAVRAFARYVPSDLVRRLIQTGEGVDLGGQSREIAIFFSDIAGFTAISETLPPEELVDRLTEYFDTVSGALSETGGTIDKYIGDAVMALWGAPSELADPSDRACHGALLARERLADLNARWQREDGPVFRTRMGIHFGRALVGNLGSSERLSYTALGDAVNVASRLESVNRTYGTEICVSETVRALSGDRFVFRPLDRVAVPGRGQGMPIYELVGFRPGVVDDPRITADEASIRKAERNREAFERYLLRDFEGAIEKYEALWEREPEDPVYQIHILRCRELLAKPPDQDWTAIFRLSSDTFGETVGGGGSSDDET